MEIFRLKESNANAALITGLAVMPSGETGRIGAPLFGGDGAGSIGMFSGYCGTLMTPMAANFNMVPAALLELPDKNAVIKAQAPTGVLLLALNIVLLNLLMFR